MSASTDPTLPPGHAPARRLAVWGRVGILYLLFCLSGLAVGLWPSALVVPKEGASLPLPTLACLAVGQTVFFLLIYPLAILKRREFCPWAGILECAILLAAAAPLDYAAAYFSDATATDVVRSTMGVAAVVPLALAAGAWLRRGGARRSVAFLLLLVLALGLPMTLYLSLEMLGGAGSDAIWNLAPATFAWDNAQGRLGGIFPSPAWPMAAWVGAAGAMACANVIGSAKK